MDATSYVGNTFKTSPTCESFSSASTVETNVTNLSLTITTRKTGRVFIGLIPDSTFNPGSWVGIKGDVDEDNSVGVLGFVRDTSTGIAYFHVGPTHPSTSGIEDVIYKYPPGSFWFIDQPGMGTFLYRVTVTSLGVANTMYVTNCRLVVYEM